MSESSSKLTELVEVWKNIDLNQELVVGMENAVPALVDSIEENDIVQSLNQLLLCQTSATRLNQLMLNHTSRNNLCGYVFQHGDIAFNCRTCQQDDTCVLCLSCYQNSNHEGHEVLFHRTTPGGCCDCGDEEAWKPSGFCTRHGQQDSRPQESSLPPSLIHFGRILIQQSLKYIAATCKASKYSFDQGSIQSGLIAMDTPPFHVRICNDDVHTDDELVRSLTRKSVSNAAELTRKIDAEGIGTLQSVSSLSRALEMQQVLQQETWLVNVVDDAHVRHERISLKLVQWLVQLLDTSPVFLQMVGEQMIEDFGPFVSYDPYLTKPLVLALHDLYIRLLGLKEIKVALASAYLSQYEGLMDLFFEGIGTQSETIFNFGVQLFTTPSVVHALATQDLFQILIRSLHDGLHLAMNDTTFNVAHRVIKYKRYMFVIRDLEYALNIQGMAQHMMQSPDLVEMWLKCLGYMQGMNSQLRQTQDHVEYETHAWVFAFNLHLNFSTVLPILAEGISSPQVVDTIVQAMTQYSIDRKNYSMSFHYPLHHFVARVLLHFDFQVDMEHDQVLCLVEYPLRTLCFIAQIQAGMWRRNGVNTTMGQLINYSSPPTCRGMRDLDLRLVQYGMVKLGPTFPQLYFQRFQLIEWLEQDVEDEFCLGLAEDCFLFLIWLVTDLRPSLRREIVHRLAEKPCLHSELLERASLAEPKSTLDHTARLQQVLDEIADQKPSADDSPSRFELKPDVFEAEYDPAFYHLSKTQHVEAQTRNRRKKPTDPIVSPMPMFQSGKNLLYEPYLLQSIGRVLNKSNCSELLLVRLVHLLTLQWYETQDPVLMIQQLVQYDIPTRLHAKEASCGGIRYLLAQYAAVDATLSCLLPSTTDIRPQSDMKKQRQREAMERMMKQQALFADSNMEDDGEEQVVDDRPDCIICSVKDDRALMYVGFVQRSGVLLSTTDEPYQLDSRTKASLHVSLCSHALHFDCWQGYFSSMQRNTVAIEISRGEFLCPLCQSLSNILVPHFPTSLEPLSTDRMEMMFQTKQNPTALRDWWQNTLPQLVLNNDPMQQRVSKEAMEQFAKGLIRIGADDLQLDSNCIYEKVHTIFACIAFTLRTCSLSINSLEQKRLHLLLRVLKHIPVFYPSYASYQSAIREVMYQHMRNAAHWDDWTSLIGHNTGRLLMLCQPLVVSDLFYHLIVWISILNRTECIMMIRWISLFHLYQLKKASRCVETEWKSFLQRMALILEVLFLEDQDYLNFVNTLDPTATDLTQLMEQLGLPSFEHPDIQSMLSTYLLPESSVEIPVSLRKSITFGAIDIDSHQSFIQLSDPFEFSFVKLATDFIRFDTAYTDLHVRLTTGQVCPTTGQRQENPAICFLCGEIICAGSDCCKRSSASKGACTRHAQEYHYGLGIYFLLRKCTVLLIYNSRSCYFHSIYVDAFGEEDLNVRRGRPLYLSTKRLELLQQLYQTHQLANQVSQIRRQADHYIRSNFY